MTTEKPPVTLRGLIGRRALLYVSPSRFSADKVQEMKIIEVSPSGQWTKLMNHNGTKFWKQTTEIAIVELLEFLKPEDK